MSVLDSEYLDAIRKFEGYSPQAQWDYKQYSSGYGTKAQEGDASLSPEQLKAVYEQRYQDEIAKAAAHVDQVNPNLPPGARAALVSLTYNAGPGWSNAGLGDLVRKGDLEGAQAKLLEYNKAGGEVNKGLVARRAQEASWFNNPLAAGQIAQPQPQSILPASMAKAPSPIFPVAGPVASAQAPEPQPTQQANGGGGGGYFSGVSAEQMAMQPIFVAPRRQVDLTKLKAALAANRFSFGGRA